MILRGRQLWVKIVQEQQRWIAEHGGDLIGYLANYHGRHGRTEENAREIYNADLAYLKQAERHLAACR
jgi:hypothetical protein